MIESARIAGLLASLERLTGGDLEHRIPLTGMNDEVDAAARAINTLVERMQIAAQDLRNAQQEAAAANTAKVAFLRHASHEIRTPLSAVLMMSNLIATGRLPENRVADLHQRIVSNGDVMIGILDQLLDTAPARPEKS